MTCMMVVEMESVMGRWRTQPMPEAEVSAYIEAMSGGFDDAGLSDLWCITHDDQNCPE